MTQPQTQTSILNLNPQTQPTNQLGQVDARCSYLVVVACVCLVPQPPTPPLLPCRHTCDVNAGQGQLGRVPAFSASSGVGRPDAAALLTPQPVPGLASAIGPDVADIGAGAYGSFAISGRGAVAAWGLNNGGQLALPLAASQDGEQCVWVPTAVPALSAAAGVVGVAGGEHHSVALTRSGSVLAFGSSNYGMLGRSGLPRPVGKQTMCVPEPGPVAAADGLGSEAPTSLAAGVHVSACVTASGELYVWGSNVNGQMAKGAEEEDNEAPARVRRTKAFGNRRVLLASFGGQHAALLATEDLGPAAGGAIIGDASPPAGAAPVPAAARGATHHAAGPPSVAAAASAPGAVQKAAKGGSSSGRGGAGGGGAAAAPAPAPRRTQPADARPAGKSAKQPAAKRRRT